MCHSSGSAGDVMAPGVTDNLLLGDKFKCDVVPLMVVMLGSITTLLTP